MSGGRAATVDDIHAVAGSMPHVTTWRPGELPIYQVGGKSFVFFRTPRPDAVDEQGRRLDDVIVIWVASEEEKQVLLADESLPLFTTPHFDGHPSVLLRASRVQEMTRDEVAELVQDAWLARASPTRARRWLREHGLSET